MTIREATPADRERLGRALDRGEDAALVEHDVHPILVRERCEDLPADPERRSAVVILLDRLRHRQRHGPGLVRCHSHARKYAAGL